MYWVSQRERLPRKEVIKYSKGVSDTMQTLEKIKTSKSERL
jgi:hypothetical protein